MKMLLKPGHKIGHPYPLFAKIEQVTIDELKKKYAGAQQQPQSQGQDPGTPKIFYETIAQAEKALADQAIKVRALKATAEKAVWQPEVNIMLDIKQQLENLKNNKPTVSDDSLVNVEDLETLVNQQGEKVRKLKSSGVDKAIVKVEVDVLLDLKKKLAAAKGEPAPLPAGKNKKKK